MLVNSLSHTVIDLHLPVSLIRLRAIKIVLSLPTMYTPPRHRYVYIGVHRTDKLNTDTAYKLKLNET